MRRYADKSTEAAHYVQYDQGKITKRFILIQIFILRRRRSLVNDTFTSTRLSC